MEPRGSVYSTIDVSGELPLEMLSVFQSEDPLNKAIIELLSGVSIRKYAHTFEGDASGTVCTSKSEVSRRFIEGIDNLMQEFFTRRLDQEDYLVMMADGLELGKMTIPAAMGIDSDGKKRILGIAEGGLKTAL